MSIENISFQEAENIFQKFAPRIQLADFLKDTDFFRAITVALREEKHTAGLAFGIIFAEKIDFFLHFFGLFHKYNDKEKVERYLQEFFHFLKEEYQIKNIYFSLNQKDDREPEIVKNIKTFPGCKVESEIYVRQVGIKTKDFSWFQQFSWYCPDLLEKKGFEVILWDSCEEIWKNKIHEDEKNGDVPEDYLSPGVWEKEWEYDPGTSFVLKKKDSPEPLGWIICEKLTDDTVCLRRFYIYKEYRRYCMGPAFSTWVLEQIAKQYDNMKYEVVKGNRQMEMFTRKYCRSILDYHYFRCKIKINLL